MKKTKIIRRRNYLDPWRIGETESWLTDMSAKGLHLTNIGIFHHFERGKPINYRYRIEYKVRDREQITAYEESGWDFVAENRNFYVFRSPESADIPEIHTDTAEMYIQYRSFLRNHMIIRIMTSLICLICIWHLFKSWSGHSLLLENLNFSLSIPLELTVAVGAVYYVISSTQNVWAISSSLKEGRQIEHRSNWRNRYRNGKLIFYICEVMLLASLLFNIFELVLLKEITPPLINNDAHLLRLSDIEDYAVRKTGENGIDYANYVRYRRGSVLAHLVIHSEETGLLPDRAETLAEDHGTIRREEYNSKLVYDLYHLRINRLADMLFRDIRDQMEEYTGFGDEFYKVTDNSYFSNIYVSSRRMSNYPQDIVYLHRIAAQHEGFVFRVHYYGAESTDSILDAMNSVITRMSTAGLLNA